MMKNVQRGVEDNYKKDQHDVLHDDTKKQREKDKTKTLEKRAVYTASSLQLIKEMSPQISESQ